MRLLFVQVDDALKDNAGTEALNAEGLMQRAVQAIKRAVPDMVVMTDVALDPFRRLATTGLWGRPIVNDPPWRCSPRWRSPRPSWGGHGRAQRHDGRPGGAIRAGLDQAGHTDVGILSYSAKYASCFYGPFRDALDSAPDLATSAPTKWTRPTSEKDCGKWPWTSPKAPTW